MATDLEQLAAQRILDREDSAFPVRASRPTVPRRKGHARRKPVPGTRVPRPSYDTMREVFDALPDVLSLAREGRARVRVGGHVLDDGEDWIAYRPLSSVEHVRVPHQGSRSSNRISLLTVPDGDSTRHIWMESKAEKAHCMNALWAYRPVSVMSQPTTLQWKLEAGTSIEHTPDLLLEDPDGQRHMFDVKRASMFNMDFAVQVRLTEAWCHARGLTYSVLGEMPAQRVRNLVNLHHAANVSETYRERGARLLEQVEEPHSVAWIAQSFGGFSQVGPALRHLLWRRSLIFDINSPLRLSTWLEAGESPRNDDSFTYNAGDVTEIVALADRGGRHGA